jgi:hypothetical protein
VASRRYEPISNAKGFSLTPPDRKLTLDREVIELLRDNAQLLAIADAVAATQAPSPPAISALSWWRRLARPRGRVPSPKN